MSVQIALLAPATRVASRKLGPTAGSCSGSPARPQRRAGLGDEQVGEHVWQMGDAGHQAIMVSASIAVGRAPMLASSRCRRSYSTPVVPPVGVRYQVAPVEEVLARVLDARGLGAGERMAADEALVARRLGEQALGGADVGDHALRPGGGQRGARRSRASAPTGAATNTTSAPATAPARSSACESMRPARAPPRGRADRCR